ncbi:penicillin-binding protein 1C [Pontibacterium granulatum]|uniref:penicillin-binding protein 1C n=1 Tax=Pontibacterium granulatum TaxID=2036029 RepID=UPI002499FA1B|nr:penicillin-binding protein 1C [Pontibacterium granulatum]MDI3323938.1 penicillin-binding protein 1C [Pontibacterium granulatum]
MSGTLKWSGVGALSSALLLLVFLWSLDQCYPVAAEPRVSTVVLAEDGTPLRAFPGENHQWRYPVTLQQVSPAYLELLLAYEDRWFYQHPGINPLALVRAFWQNLHAGRVVSGGSTLTMQVARLLYPHDRSYGGKLLQVLRALQLEWHYSKGEILNLYLNIAPFGGTLSGVQAASYYYFDKPALQLTDAEAALLAVLPQRPSVYRPDRHPKTARNARDKVLQRMLLLGKWPQARVEDARREPLVTFAQGMPNVAPLLARRLYQDCPDCAVINTLIDFDLQVQLETMVRQYSESLSDQHSVAVMAMRNDDGAVRAYVGSADFWSRTRAGQVDIIQAVRSPGSTLKPFLYGFALDAGLIHSHSLLIDAPRHKSHYRPGNFNGHFNGPVTATEALQRSLNVPAVQLIEHFGADRFITRLQNGGLKTFGPGSVTPNTSVILGGVGVQLESLVGLYSALARAGQSIQPRLIPQQATRERYLLSPGAAWIVQDMLAQHPYRRIGNTTVQRWDLAWKTGTSYGYREAWAIGTSAEWTIGVWVGRPDGSASPGRYGRVTAAPLLFGIHAALPSAKPLSQPASVSRLPICWPLGTSAERQENAGDNCLKRHQAWLLNDTSPYTLPEGTDLNLQPVLSRIWMDSSSGERGDPTCLFSDTLITKQIALWPTAVQPWIPVYWRNHHRLPTLAEACRTSTIAISAPLKIISWPDQAQLRLPGAHRDEALDITLEAEGGSGYRDWYLNGGYIGRSRKRLPYQLMEAGTYQISVVDQQGSTDMVEIRVLH